MRELRIHEMFCGHFDWMHLSILGIDNSPKKRQLMWKAFVEDAGVLLHF